MHLARDEGSAIVETCCPATVDVHCVSKSTCPLNAWVFINSGVTNSRTSRQRMSLAALCPVDNFQRIFDNVSTASADPKRCANAGYWEQHCESVVEGAQFTAWNKRKGLGSGGGTRRPAETKGDSSRDQDALFCPYNCARLVG